MPGRRSFTGLLLALLLVPAICQAKTGLPLSFHGIRVLGIEPEEASSLKSVLVDSLQQVSGLRLEATVDEVANQCQRDRFCHCRKARELNTDRAVLANVGHLGNLYTFELVLLDTRMCDVVNSVFHSEKIAPDQLEGTLRRLVRELTRPRESVSQTVVKADRDVKSVPATVHVITARQIRELGITSLAELFQLIPGFEVLDANWGGRVLHLGLPETILLMVDGIPVNNPANNFRYFSRDFQMALNHIDRVEFVRGPSSVLWGRNALLGMVNFITRAPTDSRPRMRTGLRYGTFDDNEISASIEQNRERFGYFFSATLQSNHGRPGRVDDSMFGFDPDGNAVWGNGGNTDNRTDVYYDLIGQVSVERRLKFGIQFLYNKDFYQLSTRGALLDYPDNGFWNNGHRFYWLEWADRLAAGFRYRLNVSRYEYHMWESFCQYPPRPEAYPEGRRYFQGNRTEPMVNQLAEARVYHTWKEGIWKNEVLAGLSYLDQHMPTIYATLSGTRVEPDQPHMDMLAKKFDTLSTYVHDELALWNWLYLEAGLRYEHRQPFESVLMKQAAVMLTGSDYNAKLIYAEGFRTPLANVLYSTTGVQGNPDLKCESSRSVSLEAGYELDPLSLRWSGMWAELTDQIILDASAASPGFSFRPLNKGQTEIWSTFFEARIHWSNTLSGFASYHYVDFTELDPIGYGTPLAHHKATLGISYRPLDDWSLFATGAVLDGRRVMISTPTTDQDVPLEIPVSYRLALGLWIHNLFAGFDLGVKLDNPLGNSWKIPYQIGGNVSPLVENRTGGQLIVSLRYSTDLTSEP